MIRWTANSKATLREFLSERLGISKNKAKDLIDSRNVFVNQRRVWMASHPVQKGDIIEVPDMETAPNNSVFLPVILYEDDTLIAVSKPFGMLTNEGFNSLESVLKRSQPQIQAIHRLDEDTSGVLLLAKNQKVFQAFREYWKKREVQKTYLAISHNEAQFQTKTIATPIDGKKALTHIRLLSKGSGASLFEIDLETGRKHQIRIHLSSIRHPVVGDGVYGPKRIEDPNFKSVTRQMLHAWKIRFQNPLTGKETFIEAPIPDDFQKMLSRLKLFL